MQNNYSSNREISRKAKDLSINVTDDGLDELGDIIQLSLYTDSVVPMPMSPMDNEEPENDELRLKMEMIYDTDGNTYYPMYTDRKQIDKDRNSPLIVDAPIEIVLKAALIDEESKGIVINPFTYDVFLSKEIIRTIIKNYENPFSA